MEYAVVMVTTKDRDEAQRISYAILQEHLAACVNIVPKIESQYWWEGKITIDAEVLMIIKTKHENVSKLITRVKALHSYTIPEIIELSIVQGNPEYLSWISRHC